MAGALPDYGRTAAHAAQFIDKLDVA